MTEKGEIKGWIDASEKGSGNWMKYIRNCSRSENQNLMAVQIEEEVSSKFMNDYNYVLSFSCVSPFIKNRRLYENMSNIAFKKILVHGF